MREDIEKEVYEDIESGNISISRGREILGFKYMEEMRDFLDRYEDAKK